MTRTPDVTSSDFKATAHGFYRELRRAQPVYEAKLPDAQTAWLLTRYEDVNRALVDERLFKDKRKPRKRAGITRLPGLYAREPIEVAGVTVPEHALVCPVLASANRDDEQFERADELDIGRDPNRHLAFGDGIHFRLGAPLARLEGRIALDRLLSRRRPLRLVVPASRLRWRPGLNLRASNHFRSPSPEGGASARDAGLDVDRVPASSR